MKKAEYNEFRSIRADLKKHGWGHGTALTIRVDASPEYKKALDNLYMEAGFHPASVRVDNHFFDDKLRIVYIYGLTFDLRGEEHPWTELYTEEEKARFAAALN